jgi:hypothetical protein
MDNYFVDKSSSIILSNFVILKRQLKCPSSENSVTLVTLLKRTILPQCWNFKNQSELDHLAIVLREHGDQMSLGKMAQNVAHPINFAKINT